MLEKKGKGKGKGKTTNNISPQILECHVLAHVENTRASTCSIHMC